MGALKPNPGMRFISKLCLNSLWGKFGQNTKPQQNEYINEEKDFYKIVLDDKIESVNIHFVTDDMIYVSYRNKDEFLRTNYNTNIFVACFTTSWARMRLYDLMEKLGESICYCDTDSIVYTENKRTKSIVENFLGDSLGE